MDYLQEIEEKLQAARKRVRQGNEVKQLKASAPTLFEIMDTEISLLVNKMTAPEPLSKEEYLDAHGQIRGIMRIRNLLDAKEVEMGSASQEVEVIEDNIKQIKDDRKAQSK